MRILFAESWSCLISAPLPRRAAAAAPEGGPADVVETSDPGVRARPAHPGRVGPGRVDPTRSRSGTALRFAGGCRKAGETNDVQLGMVTSPRRQPREAGPACRAAGRRLAVLGLLFASSLLQTGCQSGRPDARACSVLAASSAAPRAGSCSRSAMARRLACGPDCGSEGGCVSSGVPVETMTPGTVIVPGATMAPGTMPSNQLSAPAEVPSNLEPLPEDRDRPAPVGDDPEDAFGLRRPRPAPATRPSDPITGRAGPAATTWRIP